MNFFSCWHEFFYFKKFMLAWIFSKPLVSISNTIFGSPDQPRPSQTPCPITFHHFWGVAPLQSRLPYINSISQLLVSRNTSELVHCVWTQLWFAISAISLQILPCLAPSPNLAKSIQSKDRTWKSLIVQASPWYVDPCSSGLDLQELKKILTLESKGGPQWKNYFTEVN